jgi:hypothetical protein
MNNGFNLCFPHLCETASQWQKIFGAPACHFKLRDRSKMVTFL